MIRVYSTGRVRQKRGARGIRRYLVDDWGDATLPVNIFLIEHPDGLCLVDCGQTAEAGRPGFFPAWYPFFRLARFELSAKDEAASQLVAGGVDPDRVRWIVLTHLHTDHVGGIGDFPFAQVLVSRTEWNLAQGLGGQLRGYLPQYWPSTVAPLTVEFSGPALGPFSGSHDITGDGSMVMVPLPGHTRGHAGLLVRTAAGAAFLCAGDAAHTAAEFSVVAPAVSAWCRAERVVVLTSHDDAAAELLRGPP